jgi:hypothetical protein
MLKNLSSLLLSFFSAKRQQDLKNKFTKIHDLNLFKGDVSISGTGSDLIQTQVISLEIPKLLEKYKVKTFIDAPCGDLYWMQHVQFYNVKYIGLDIVNELIIKNNEKFANENRIFICKNIVTDILPVADIIFIRDCWVHLNYQDTISCIMNLKSSKIKYLLTTSFPNTFKNKDLYRIWRPLNLNIEPFNFPIPIETINEGCTENGGKYKDKSLMLWEIATLPDYII